MDLTRYYSALPYAPRFYIDNSSFAPFYIGGNVTSISKIHHCIMHIYDPSPLETCPMTSRQYAESRRDVPANPGPNTPLPIRSVWIQDLQLQESKIGITRPSKPGRRVPTKDKTKKKKRRATTNRIWSLSRAKWPNLLFLLDVQLVVILLTYALVT